MLLKVHAQLLREALEGKVSGRALKAITAANLAQDDLPNQVGHDELHFDNNALREGEAYIKAERLRIAPALLQGSNSAAWGAFGRLSHTAQDFYAHTNYIRLWAAEHPSGAPPEGVDPLDPRLLQSPDLHSGRLYYPRELLYFIPPLRKWALSFLPADSHARMNLDSEASGPLFAHAYAAALERTRHELEQLRHILPPDLYARFCDLEGKFFPAVSQSIMTVWT